MKYIYIICPFVSLIVCQLIKMIYETVKYKKFEFNRLYGSGSMPSAHSSFISSLTFIIGFNEGFDSAIFALSLIFMLITCYDAISVRFESGRHAKILNEKFNLKMKYRIGHKLLEVVVGILLGFITATVFYINLI